MITQPNMVQTQISMLFKGSSKFGAGHQKRICTNRYIQASDTVCKRYKSKIERLI